MVDSVDTDATVKRTPPPYRGDRVDTSEYYDRNIQLPEFSGIADWQDQLERVFFWIRQRMVLVAVVTILGLLAGIAYSVLTPARYTAVTEMLVDPAKLQVVSDDIHDPNAARESQLLDAEGMVRIMTSGNVLSRVVAGLGLSTDPEFAPEEGGLLSRLLGSTQPPADAALLAQRTLADHISARREDRSFIVSLSVWSHEPAKAVQISNALVEAFLAELSQADADSAGRTARALTDRLEELRQAVNASEEAVESFKRANQLQFSGGELLSTQTMGLLNTQLVEAQQRLIDASTRFEQLSGMSAELSPAAQLSPTMTALRSQYAAAQQQYQAQLPILGDRHPTLTTLRAQVQALAAQINAEKDRLVGAARAEYDQALSALAELQRSSNAVRSSVSVDNEAQVQLRELERDAASKSAIYEAFLTRAQQVTERQRIDTTNVRVITPATMPAGPSSPQGPMRSGLAGAATALVLALLVAAGLGFWSDLREAPRKRFVGERHGI